MSTRCNIHFSYGKEVQSNIYRHYDGYPKGVLADITRFFHEVNDNLLDKRFDDPEYLSAKFVVWQAARYVSELAGGSDKSYLNFLGIGITNEDHGDIEFIYNLDCSNLDENGFPTITVEEPEF